MRNERTDLSIANIRKYTKKAGYGCKNEEELYQYFGCSKSTINKHRQNASLYFHRKWFCRNENVFTLLSLTSAFDVCAREIQWESVCVGVLMSVSKRERERECVFAWERHRVCMKEEQRVRVPLRVRQRDCVVIDLLESSCFIFLSLWL